MRGAVRPWSIVGFALAALAGCGGSGLPSDGTDAAVGHELVSIAVMPPAATLAPGTHATFTALGTNADGTTDDLTAKATWSSSDPTVANGSGGELSANKPGAVLLTAKSGAIAGSAQITVTGAKVSSVATDPATAGLTVGGMVSIHATATFSDGSKTDVTQGAAWSSLDTSLAKVSMAGVATGVSAGQTGIVASFGGQSGTTTVTVGGKVMKSIKIQPQDVMLVPHTAFHFTATATYDDATTGDVTPFANWTSSMPGIVSVSAGGLANTIAEGNATITATVGGVSDVAMVTVIPLMLLTIDVVAPDGAILPPNGVAQVTAIGSYIDGSKADLTQSVAWSSDMPMVLGVSTMMGSAGVLSALVPGSATLSATLGNVTGTMAMKVTNAKLGNIELTLLDEVVPKGTVLHYTATGVYSDGSYIPLTRDVAWTVDDGTVATVSNAFPQNGTAATLKPGETGVHATFAGVSQGTTLTVTAANLDAIDIAPGNISVKMGTTQQLTATAHYSDNTMADVTALASWSSTDGKVATVSNMPGTAGLLSAGAQGNTTVGALFDKVLGTTSVSVIQ